MTQLEKASFVLNAKHDTPSEELGGRLYINVTEKLSVALHDDTIAYLAECYDELNQ
jgi:L-2-hydroxyglutarate oxidase LhgO